MKGSRLVIRRVTDGETHEVAFRWTISRKPDTNGMRVCNAFVDGSKVGATMGGGYDLARDAMINWLEGKVQPDDYGDWLCWERADLPVAMAVLDSVQKRDEFHLLPRISTGRTLASLLWCLGFEIVMDEHGQPGAGVEAARGDGHGR